MRQLCKGLIRGYRFRLFLKAILQINAYLLIVYLASNIVFVISGLPFVPLEYIFLIVLVSVIASAVIALMKNELYIIRDLDSINGLYEELLTVYQYDTHNVFIDKIAEKIRSGSRVPGSLSINPLPNILQIFLSVLLIWFIHTGTYAVDESNPHDGTIAGSEEVVQPGFDMDVLAFPRSGTAPLSVIFQPRVENGISIDSYEWNFGDKYYSEGGVSGDVTPVHKYNVPGIYTVTLLIKSGGKSYRIIKEDYIIVSSGNKQAGKGSDNNPLAENRRVNNPYPDLNQIKRSEDNGEFKVDPKIVDLESKGEGDIERDISKTSGARGDGSENYEDLYNEIRSFDYKRRSLIENISQFDSEFLESFYQNLLEGNNTNK